MKRFSLIVLLSCFLAACNGPETDYMAVYQVLPDAHVMYLGNHYYIARNTDGNTYLVKINEHGEAISVERIF